MRTLTPLLLIVVLAGCNPYVAAVTAVSKTYGVAVDERSVSTQADDTEIEGKIKAALLESPVSGTSGIDVTSRRGVVLLAGVVPPGSPAGSTAVQIALGTPGVRRVETFFVPDRPSRLSDMEIQAKVKAAFVADPNVIADQVDISVYSGHVVLIGVVDSWQQVDEFVDDARSVGGVASVRSYIQVKS